MAEQETPKINVPWGTLLPLIAVLAGIIAQYKPLVSSRPATPGEKSVEAIAVQDVDARLWQDPLAVARKEKEAHEAEEAKGGIEQETHKLRHRFKALADRIEEEMKEPSNRVLLLAVMLDAGPYIEQGESRLRSRRAVLEGLNQSGFAPVDAEHIGFVMWPLDKRKPDEDKLLIPWEECRASENPFSVYPRDAGQVFILWLPAADFNPFPLRRFAALISDLTQGMKRNKISVKLIGPTGSSGLQYMIQEARNQLPAQTDPDNMLDGVTIISPRATVMDEALLSDLLPDDASESAARSVPDVSLSSKASVTGQKTETSPGQLNIAQPETEISQVFPPPNSFSIKVEQPETQLSQVFPPATSFSIKDIIERATSHRALRFVRTIAQDDVVLGKLIDELQLRGVEVKKSVEKKGNRDQTVILTEWDSAYGRSLARTFAAVACGHSYREIFQGKYPWPRWILSYEYLRGIDGRLPGEQSKSSEQKENLKEQVPTQPKPEEATEGVDQSDYLRRLARELKKQDRILQRQHKGRIRAIGLLGSDIYDKLMMLRALRPEFPEAIFFTNNFDAHFERHADWGDVRNLVIASPFGSQLPPPWQFNVIPFRDSTQTSMFMGTLVATGLTDKLMDKDTMSKLTKEVNVFEVGRRGAYDLNGREKYWFRDWLKSRSIKIFLGLAVLTLLGMTVWLSLGIVDTKFPRGGTLGEHFRYLLCNTPFWLIWGSPLVILVVCRLVQTTTAAQEPLEFFQGISIWPTEMLRVIAFLLAIHFMIKARVSLKANEKEIADRFCLDTLPAGGSVWRNLWEGLKPWQRAHPDWFKPVAEFSAEEAWYAYLRRNQSWPRFFRVALLCCIYFAFVFALTSLFTGRVPFVPARGPTAFLSNYYVGRCATICMMVLSFYVVDAIQLNGNFIRVFTRGLTKWKSAVSARCKRVPPLSEDDLSRYHDVFFVAQRTEEVARLVWYPLIVLAMLVVARSSFFANWTWPLVLILTFALNAMWAIGSAIFLRRAAELLRTTAIENLQLLRLTNHSVKRKRQAFDELITEIRSLKKGAFAPLSEQHFIRAILLPGAGLGLLAVGQRLFEGF